MANAALLILIQSKLESSLYINVELARIYSLDTGPFFLEGRGGGQLGLKYTRMFVSKGEGHGSFMAPSE